MCRKRPRITVRSLMVAVAIVAFFLGMRIELRNRRLWLQEIQGEEDAHRLIQIHRREVQVCKEKVAELVPYDMARVGFMESAFRPLHKLSNYFRSWASEANWRYGQLVGSNEDLIECAKRRESRRQQVLFPWLLPWEDPTRLYWFSVKWRNRGGELR